MKKTIAIYGLTLALYVPALLTNYLGICPQYAQGQSCWFVFWDFYESTFVLIALLDFIPLSFVADRLPKGIYRVGFLVTGAWMLIFAIPDVFLSYVGPWILNVQMWQYYFNDYNAVWFGDASIAFLLLNFYFFFHSTVFATRIVPKGKGQSEAQKSAPPA